MIARALELIDSADWAIQSDEWRKKAIEFKTAVISFMDEPPITVEGKHTELHLKAPAFIASSLKKPDGLFLRIEDGAHPDFWLDIFIPNYESTADSISANRDDPC